MSINLVKGSPIVLDKEQPVNTVKVELGWDARTTDGAKFDCDANAILLNADGKIINNLNFIYYNNKVSPCGSVKLSEDNCTGEGQGADEVITLNLSTLPEDVKKVIISVNIYDESNANLNFGQISNAFVNIIPEVGETLRYDLTEDKSSETLVQVVEIYRHNGNWRVKAIDQGYTEGLQALLNSYGAV